MIHLFLMTFIFYFSSCEGADPILDKASTVQKKETTLVEKANVKAIDNETTSMQSKRNIDQQLDVENKTITEIKTVEEQIIVSGKITVENWSGNKIRIDIFDGDQQSLTGPRPSVVKVEYQSKPGPFQISVPKSEKGIWIGGYVDEDGDGKPGPKDPSGWYEYNPVSVQDNVKDIHLVLSIPRDLEE